MTPRPELDKIEIHLVRVLHVLITERNVSRAALKLDSTQPAVSAQLKRLRELTGDALLVRAGQAMVPTDTALTLLEPAARLLREAERIFATQPREFDPTACTLTFRIAASDFLDPFFLPGVVARVKQAAPGARIELHSLSEDLDYRRSLANGTLDLAIGNWLEPPGELHLGHLLADEVVCLVSSDHPATRAAARGAWHAEDYLACEHVAPMPLYPGARGVIDEHLHSRGLHRNITVRASHFGLIPLMSARSLLVLTTGRLFCTRYAQATMPVSIIPCPVPFPPLAYYQLWHDATHTSAPMRWLREQVRDVAAGLRSDAARDAAPAAPTAHGHLGATT